MFVRPFVCWNQDSFFFKIFLRLFILFWNENNPAWTVYIPPSTVVHIQMTTLEVSLWTQFNDHRGGMNNPVYCGVVVSILVAICLVVAVILYLATTDLFIQKQRVAEPKKRSWLCEKEWRDGLSIFLFYLRSRNRMTFRKVAMLLLCLGQTSLAKIMHTLAEPFVLTFCLSWNISLLVFYSLKVTWVEDQTRIQGGTFHGGGR